MIPDAKLDELLAKAERCELQGPWQASEVEGEETHIVQRDGDEWYSVGIAYGEQLNFIMAADPETIAALVAEVKRWRAMPQQIAHLANAPHTRAARHGRLFVDYEALKDLFPEAMGERA